MKREYVAPTAEFEEFVANEYVAACANNEKIYFWQVSCEGKGNGDHIAPGTVFPVKGGQIAGSVTWLQVYDENGVNYGIHYGHSKSNCRKSEEIKDFEFYHHNRDNSPCVVTVSSEPVRVINTST